MVGCEEEVVGVVHNLNTSTNRMQMTGASMTSESSKPKVQLFERKMNVTALRLEEYWSVNLRTISNSYFTY